MGVGINYTIFFDEKFPSTYKEASFSALDLDGSFGLPVQLGADDQLDKRWSLNAFARYMDINTDTSFKVGGSVNGSAEVEIDPMVYSLMLAYKF